MLIAKGVGNFLISAVLLEEAGGCIVRRDDGARVVDLHGDVFPLDVSEGIYCMAVMPFQASSDASITANGAVAPVSAERWHEL